MRLNLLHYHEFSVFFTCLAAAVVSTSCSTEDSQIISESETQDLPSRQTTVQTVSSQGGTEESQESKKAVEVETIAPGDLVATESEFLIPKDWLLDSSESIKRNIDDRSLFWDNIDGKTVLGTIDEAGRFVSWPGAPTIENLQSGSSEFLFYNPNNSNGDEPQTEVSF